MTITHPSTPNSDSVEVALGRLDAAQDHYLELQRLWREYCKRVESRVEIRLVATLNRAEYVWHMSEQPSTIMATQARASVSEARSALDNLVYGLAQASGAGEPALRAVQFPVTRRRRDWADAVDRCLQAVPVKYHDPIADTQPFSHPRYGHVAHPLEFLQRSHNADKHHAPITLGVMPFFPPWTKTQIATLTAEMPREILKHAEEVLGEDLAAAFDFSAGPLADGDILATALYPDRALKAHMNVNLPPLSLMAYQSGKPILDPVLDQLANAISYARSAVEYIGGRSSVLTEALPANLVPRKPKDWMP